MKAKAVLSLGNILIAAAALVAVSAPSPKSDVPPAPVAWRGTRGVNLHTWFTWTDQISPSTYRTPVFQHMPGEISASEAVRIRAAGFDFVRLTVDPLVFTTLKGKDLTQAQNALFAGVGRLNAAGLSVIVDQHTVHGVHPVMAKGLGGAQAIEAGSPQPMIDAFIASSAKLAGQIDSRFSNGKVAFELFNEPLLECEDPRWEDEQVALHAAVRKAAPHLTLVLTGSCSGAIVAMLNLHPERYADQNVLYTLHFYDPLTFSHQGTGFTDMPGLTPIDALPYPAAPALLEQTLAHIQRNGEKLPPAQVKAALALTSAYFAQGWNTTRIEGQFDKLQHWRIEHHVASNQLLMGEFGVNFARYAKNGARAEDRLRWLTDVRKAAESRGIRWAAWAYINPPNPNSDFALIAKAGNAIDSDMAQALGLPKP